MAEDAFEKYLREVNPPNGSACGGQATRICEEGDPDTAYIIVEFQKTDNRLNPYTALIPNRLKPRRRPH
jgi:hypothetical protein